MTSDLTTVSARLVTAYSLSSPAVARFRNWQRKKHLPEKANTHLHSFMDAPDNPTSLKEVELTEEDDTPPEKKTETREQLTVDVEITFWTHVGWDGVLVMLLSLGIAGLFVWIVYLYTKKFQAWHRPGVWVFMVFAVLYVLLVAKCLWTWRKVATAFTEQQQAGKEENQQRKRSRSAIERAKQAAGNAKNVYEKLQINGEWFLWKLYVSELFESAQQCINLVTVYLCSLPVEVTSFICLGLSLECLHTGWTITHKNTPARRDRQVKIDTTVDFLCVAIPLCVMWFAYNVPISIPEMLSITLMPTFSMLGKLDDILEEAINHRAAQQVLKEQSRRSLKQKRRRESLFQQVSLLEMAKEQEEKVPRLVRFVAAGCKGLFGLFFLVMAVAHLVMQPIGCDDTTWSKGCVNKIPFCNSMFTPSCNCASLEIENDKSLVKLPDSLVDDVQGLRKVFIRNCNLTALPPRMETLTEMVDFEVSFNRLQKFDVDVGKWEKLNKLYLMYNEISFVHEAVWKHLEATGFGLDTNNVMLPLESGIYMPSLTFLNIANNNMTIRSAIGKDSFPLLTDLYINGNSIEVFPREDLKDSIVYLGVARCNLNSLPFYLSMFKNLKYLDARENRLGIISEGLKHLLRKNDVEAYFAGNVGLCESEVEFDCVPVCSDTCWSKRVSGDRICDVECNTEDCKFDGGDCNFWHND